MLGVEWGHTFLGKPSLAPVLGPEASPLETSGPSCAIERRHWAVGHSVEAACDGLGYQLSDGPGFRLPSA